MYIIIILTTCGSDLSSVLTFLLYVTCEFDSYVFFVLKLSVRMLDRKGTGSPVPQGLSHHLSINLVNTSLKIYINIYSPSLLNIYILGEIRSTFANIRNFSSSS